MSDFLSQEDVAAVAEWRSFNTGFAWEGSKQSVVFSETPVPPTSQPSPTWHFGASSLSSEEEEQEEEVPSRSASEEDVTCGKGVCVDVEKDSELSEPDPRPSPATLLQQPWGGEEEEVAEDGEDSFDFRKPHGDCPKPDAPNGLPELIRCFQVVSPAPHPVPWLPLEWEPKHCSKQTPQICRGLGFSWLGLVLGADEPLNLLHSVQ